MLKHLLFRTKVAIVSAMVVLLFFSFIVNSFAAENPLLGLEEEGERVLADKEVPMDLNEEGIFVPLFHGEASADAIIATANRLLGKKYATGAVGPESFDCSGYIYFILDGYGIKSPRSSREQSEHEDWGKIENVEDLIVGDLVFFKSPGSGNAVGHVGIYMGDDEFIHSSPAGMSGVVISKINNDYYSTRFKWARRAL